MGAALTASPYGRFLQLGPGQAVPDASTLLRTRARSPLEGNDAVFALLLGLLAQRGLIKGGGVGTEASAMEANAVMRSIVPRADGASWYAMLGELARTSGILKRLADRPWMDRRARPLKRAALGRRRARPARGLQQPDAADLGRGPVGDVVTCVANVWNRGIRRTRPGAPGSVAKRYSVHVATTCGPPLAPAPCRRQLTCGSRGWSRRPCPPGGRPITRGTSRPWPLPPSHPRIHLYQRAIRVGRYALLRESVPCR